MKKPCPHGTSLPKGLICDRGYLFIKTYHKKQLHLQGCGPHTPKLEKLAIGSLYKIIEQKYLGVFGKAKTEDRMKFADALDIYYLHEWEKNPARNDNTRYNCRVRITQFKTMLGHFWTDEITGADILVWRQKRDRQGVKSSTTNKDQRILSAVFNSLRRLIETQTIAGFKLPPENPCKFVKKPSEEKYARERVPSKLELSKAKRWCTENDTELWRILEWAILTGRRKSELRALRAGDRVEGIQGKTGQRFKLPLVLDQALNWVNFDTRWERLQNAVGWQRYLDNGHTINPTHTTFHDFKHIGPTVLAELGHSNAVIQAFTQHSDPKMSDRYTNMRSLQPVVDAIRNELASI